MSATDTLETRIQKRLLEKKTWYKGWDQIKREALTKKATENAGLPYTKDRNRNANDGGLRASTGGGKQEVVTALFIDRTVDGILVKKLREAESRLANLTNYKVKIVEKNGITLSKSLVNRDPYRGWDCCRECGVCIWKPEENSTENCNLQNIVYRGICLLCEEEETLRLEELKQSNPQLEDVEDERVTTKYIGCLL